MGFHKIPKTEGIFTVTGGPDLDQIIRHFFPKNEEDREQPFIFTLSRGDGDSGAFMRFHAETITRSVNDEGQDVYVMRGLLEKGVRYEITYIPDPDAPTGTAKPIDERHAREANVQVMSMSLPAVNGRLTRKGAEMAAEQMIEAGLFPPEKVEDLITALVEGTATTKAGSTIAMTARPAIIPAPPGK